MPHRIETYCIGTVLVKQQSISSFRKASFRFVLAVTRRWEWPFEHLKLVTLTMNYSSFLWSVNKPDIYSSSWSRCLLTGITITLNLRNFKKFTFLMCFSTSKTSTEELTPLECLFHTSVSFATIVNLTVIKRSTRKCRTQDFVYSFEIRARIVIYSNFKEHFCTTFLIKISKNWTYINSNRYWYYCLMRQLTVVNSSY